MGAPRRDIDLYYAPPEAREGDVLALEGDEFRHAVRSARKREGDVLLSTDGRGSHLTARLERIERNRATLRVESEERRPKPFPAVRFCLPKLKNPNRFEFALEKAVECGVTDFVVFAAARSETRGEKLERWRKIGMAAMKQSLGAWLPEITTAPDAATAIGERAAIGFDQSAASAFEPAEIDLAEPTAFIFGPEGGLTDDELALATERRRLAPNRLRSETAILAAAAALAKSLL
ncbi:MAG: RsmE family RNA methyltransferase [Ignavibacteriales bacterium]|nr:RsmE family RNA methyltransferase [Ignavibacteriales bacterium]